MLEMNEVLVDWSWGCGGGVEGQWRWMRLGGSG